MPVPTLHKVLELESLDSLGKVKLVSRAHKYQGSRAGSSPSIKPRCIMLDARLII